MVNKHMKRYLTASAIKYLEMKNSGKYHFTPKLIKKKTQLILMATQSSTLAWRIPWREEPGRLQSMGHKESDTTKRLHFTSSLQQGWEGSRTLTHWEGKMTQ